MPRYTSTYAQLPCFLMTAQPNSHARRGQAGSLPAAADSAMARGNAVLAGGAPSPATGARMPVTEARSRGALAAAGARLGDGEWAIPPGHRAPVRTKPSQDAGSAPPADA